ncbi:MAG: saccharopine dehydrogenase family protein [Nocardioidaceae bacterium]
MPDRPGRPFDVVLLGATGFTGGLTADYLAANAPDGLRWAVAGRSPTKLEAVVERLSAGLIPSLLPADVTDPNAMRELAEQTRVLATTVGPYVEHGEPAVAACAAAGTDYCDLTGESEFVDHTWLAHHDTAVKTGSRLVHSCGFDSIPHDLGAWYTVGQLPPDVPLTVEGFVRASAGFSGGTYQSAVRGFSRVRQANTLSARRRRSEERPTGRRVRALPQRLRRGPDRHGWAVPLPTIDPVVVRRSARALDRYGPNFAYGHYAWMKHLPTVAGTVIAAGGMLAASQLPPVRDLLLRLKSSGDGPTPEQRSASWFTVRFVGAGGGKRVLTEVSGGDPGYDETAKMLAESALCLAFDDLPDVAGQVTTAQAMAEPLLARLQTAGIGFRTLG